MPDWVDAADLTASRPARGQRRDHSYHCIRSMEHERDDRVRVMLSAIVVLHPLMDQPLKFFGPKILCRRFWAAHSLPSPSHSSSSIS